MEPNFNLCTNPFSEFDDDEDEQGMEKGDRFFGSRSRSKPLTKAELDQENFVILNDEYGEYLDPESILSIFNSCGRDMDQTIDTIEEVITSSPSVISSENSGGGSLGEDAMRGGGGALSESEPCQFWLDNGWCVRRCTQIHNPEGIPCIYYNDKYKFCPAGSKCMFLHTTIEEQNARIDRNADNSLWYLNDDDVYNYDVLDKSFADFLKQIKANHGRVFGPLIDTVFDYINNNGKNYVEVEQIVIKYFDKDNSAGFHVPNWPAIARPVPDGLKTRFEKTMDIACKHKEMRRLHIEMGTAAHLRGDFDAAAGHMRLALYYNMELSSIIEDSYARLFCSPAGGHVIRLCASKTQDSFEYILSCKDLALKVVIDELFKAVPSDCITIYLYKLNPDFSEKFYAYISGEKCSTKYKYKSVEIIKSSSKNMVCLRFTF